MAARLDLQELIPEGYDAVLGLEKYVKANVDHGLLELLKLRASMVNGCAYCVDMHSTDALAAGEHVRRLFAVSAWRESNLFDERERAVLELTDAVTRLGEHGVPEEVLSAVVTHLGERGAADVVLAIATINVWNRVAIAAGTPTPELRAA